MFESTLFLTLILSRLGVFANDHSGHVSRDKVEKRKRSVKSLKVVLEKTLISILKLDEALHESFKYDAFLVEKNAKALAAKVDSIKDEKIKSFLRELQSSYQNQSN